MTDWPGMKSQRHTSSAATSLPADATSSFDTAPNVSARTSLQKEASVSSPEKRTIFNFRLAPAIGGAGVHGSVDASSFPTSAPFWALLVQERTILPNYTRITCLV